MAKVSEAETNGAGWKVLTAMFVSLLVLVVGGILAANAAASGKAESSRVDLIEARVRALEITNEQIRTDVRWIRDTMERDRKEGRP